MSDPRRRVLLALNDGARLRHGAGLPFGSLIDGNGKPIGILPGVVMIRRLEADELIERAEHGPPAIYRLSARGRSAVASFRTRST